MQCCATYLHVSAYIAYLQFHGNIAVFTYLKLDLCACDVSDASLSATSFRFERRPHCEP